jgi:hypothetical protein
MIIFCVRKKKRSTQFYKSLAEVAGESSEESAEVAGESSEASAEVAVDSLAILRALQPRSKRSFIFTFCCRRC